MKKSRLFTIVVGMVFSLGAVIPMRGQEAPADYQEVLKTLNKKGDFKSGVLKVNIPRGDLKMTIQGIATPTPFGFGGWVALSKGNDDADVMMGDLVLTQKEVNPVMSALLENGIDVTVLHSHFFWDESARLFYARTRNGKGGGAGAASETCAGLGGTRSGSGCGAAGNFRWTERKSRKSWAIPASRPARFIRSRWAETIWE